MSETVFETSRAAGKALLDMLGLFAEFETNLRRERQMEGVKAAKARGSIQEPQAYHQAEEARRLFKEGLGVTRLPESSALAGRARCQHHWVVNYLWQFESIAGLRKVGMQTPVLMVAIIVMLVGVIAFCSVFVRAI